MKKPLLSFLIIVFIISAMGGLVGCNNGMGERSPVIEQVVRKDVYMDNYMATYVWYKREIVWSRYDKMETLTDSIVLSRRNEAEKIVQLIKSMK